MSQTIASDGSPVRADDLVTEGSSKPAVEAAAAPDRAVEAGRGALYIGAAKGFFMISAFAQKWLLTRIVGSADYGAFSVVNAAVSVLNNATVQGTIQSVSKFTAEDDRQADAVKAAGLRLQLVVGALLGLGFFILAPLIAARAYEHPEFTRWFRMVALIPFVYSLYSVFVGSANGLRRFRAQAGFDITFSTLKTFLLLGGAALFGLAGAFGGFVAAAGFILVVSALVMKWPRLQGAAPFPMARLVRFMIGIVVYTLLINLALNYDLLLLRRFAAGVTDAVGANQMAGHYEAVRNFALLPYQALLVVTFVIFPLVSKSTFEQDRDATRAYVTQTLRYALILAGAMAAVLAARPRGLLLTFYKPEYAVGQTALPILVAGIVCLAMLGVAGSIINASGHPRTAGALVATTVLVGGAAAFIIVPGQAPGAPMLNAAALATALGMAAGFGASLVYLRRRFAANPPLPTVLRVLVAAALAIAAGRLMPGQGKIVALIALAAAGVIFLGSLIVLGEFGAQDRAKFRKILGRRAG
jgi:O-antigen/teichoic acid export membrane protein